MSIRKGTSVKWKWGDGYGTGKVEEIFHQDVERTIKKNKVKRQASEKEPAYLITQENGDQVLKSCTEVTPA